MHSYLVLQTPLGFYIFLDPQMLLFDESSLENPENLAKLQLKTSFLFPNFEYAAYATDSIEHKYLLPQEIKIFFENYIIQNSSRTKSSTWYFISNILSHLISDNFGLQCCPLPPNVQRCIFPYISELTGVNPDEMDQARKELSDALYSSQLSNQEEEEFGN